MSNGQQPTNMNVIKVLRNKASSKKIDARIDNVFLYSSIPKFGDMFTDHQTSAITLLHIGFVLLIIILIIIGYSMNILIVWKYGTFLGLITNIFGIIHSMYCGSISNKVDRLDAALQNFAHVIQKFAKALNIQELYLRSVKNILDFLDHHILLIQYEHPEIDNIIKGINDDKNDNNINYKNLLLIYYQFIEKLKHQTIIQHKKWLLTFFGQYKLLDNRFGITKVEYLDFIHKLPNKSRTFFQSLTGIHTRFKQLDVSDELNQPPLSSKYEPPMNNNNNNNNNNNVIEIEQLNNNRKPSIGMDMTAYKSTSVIDNELGDDTVLLYKDMTELVDKVLKDIGIINKRIQNELAEKMINKERQNEKRLQKKKYNQEQKEEEKEEEEKEEDIIPHGYILSKRMSNSLARDAPQIKMSDNNNNTNNIDAENGDESDDDDDDVYNINNIDKNKDNAPPTTNTSNFIHDNLKRIKSIDSEINSAVDLIKQKTLSMDDDWLKKVMNDLNDGDESNYYDYSHSHKL